MLQAEEAAGRWVEDFHGMDWAPPWFEPLRERGAQCVQTLVSDGLIVAEALNESRSTGIHPCFVPGDSAPPGEAYEAFIARTGGVPTRNNFHDFFNGLIWLHWPWVKRRLNQFQAGEIARDGVGATRGPLRDALTVFDENGALLDAPPPLWEALVARDWPALFITHRALWAQARLLVFGHALLDKLRQPRKGVTAHVLRMQVEMRHSSMASVDAALAGALDAQWLASKPFSPLPVLGVPGWWANENFSFYDDSDAFRPRRSAEPSITKRFLRCCTA